MAGKAKRAILIEILGDSSSYTKEAKKAGTATASFDASVKKLGTAIASTYLAKKVVDFGIASVKAAADDAAAQAVLATAMRKSTDATDDQIASMEDWITKTSHATGFLDDGMRPALAQLLRVTKDQTKAQELLTLAMDVSRGTGKDLETVSSAISKAYSGSTTALTKLVPGIKLASDGTFTFADAQQRLNEQFSGQAATYADTAQGRLERLNAQYQDMKETVGTALLPVMEQLVGIVTEVFDWFSSLDPATQDIITKVAILAGGLYVGATAFNAVSMAVKTLGINTASAMPWLAAVGVVLGGLIAVTGAFEESNAALEQRTKQVSAALANEIDQVVELARASGVGTDATSALELAQIALSKALTGSDEQGVKTAGALGTLGMQGADAAEVLSLLAGVTADGVSQQEEFSSAVQKQVKELFIAQGYTEEMAQQLSYMAAQGYISNDMWDVSKDTIADWTDEQRAAAWAAVALGQAARTADIPGISADYLNAEVATNAFREQLVATAEANAGASRSGGEANEVLDEYITLLAAMTPEQQKLYDGLTDSTEATEDLADAQVVATSAADRLTSSTEDTRSKLAAAATAASDLKAAIDAIFSPYMNMEQAQRNLQAGTDELTQSLIENGATLDITTEKGRSNREQVEEQVQAILDFGVAMVGAGASTEDAGAYVEAFTGQLKDQLKAAGLTDDQVNTYIDTLGLTPENVETTINLAEADATKRELDGLLDQLEDIDAGAESEIRAQIAHGDFDAARADIKNWAAENGIKLKVSLSGGGQIDVNPKPGGGGFKVFAWAKGGNAFEGDTGWVGEEGPELVTFGQNSTVHTAGESQRILSRSELGGGAAGGGDMIVFDMRGAIVTASDLERKLSEVLSNSSRRQGRDVTVQARVPV